jgi:hypothetical protein
LLSLLGVLSVRRLLHALSCFLWGSHDNL